MINCSNCPLVSGCIQWPHLCNLIERDPENQIYINHIINKSLNKDKKMPSLLEQATNLTSSMSKFATSGFKTVSEEVEKNRLNICDNCDELNKESRRCFKCGCFVDKKVKISTEECPLKKWLKEEIINTTSKCNSCNKSM